jgi:hypothetical protein
VDGARWARSDLLADLRQSPGLLAELADDGDGDILTRHRFLAILAECGELTTGRLRT